MKQLALVILACSLAILVTSCVGLQVGGGYKSFVKKNPEWAKDKMIADIGQRLSHKGLNVQYRTLAESYHPEKAQWIQFMDVAPLEGDDRVLDFKADFALVIWKCTDDKHQFHMKGVTLDVALRAITSFALVKNKPIEEMIQFMEGVTLDDLQPLKKERFDLNNAI